MTRPPHAVVIRLLRILVMKISGCIALVTGGASGIGRGICELLLQHDAKVNVIVFTVSESEMRSNLRAPTNQNTWTHVNITDSPRGFR